MINIYNFSLPVRLVMGGGSLERLPTLTRDLGRKVLLVTGQTALRKIGILDRVLGMLAEEDLEVALFDRVESEPSTKTVDKGARLAKEESCQVVIGLGGGSAIDAAKAIAGIANKDGSVEEYQTGRRLESPGLPFIAIPTTSGTGAEVTPNAVLINRDKKVKKSFRDSHLFARLAIIDPELTLSLPPKITAYSGMDALCQSIESFISLGSNPLTDSLSIKAIELIGRSLLKAYQDGSDIQARTEMSYGALLAGIALFNARMGVIHGIAHPFGAMYSLGHGLVCGVLLPYGMEFNLDVAYGKYARIASIFGEGLNKDKEMEGAKLAISRIRELLARLNFPKGLKELGAKEEDFPHITRESMPSGSLRANPKKTFEDDVIEILKRAL